MRWCGDQSVGRRILHSLPRASIVAVSPVADLEVKRLSRWVGVTCHLGSTISEAHAAAAASTTTVVPAAHDEVSAAIAASFGSHASNSRRLAPKLRRFTASCTYLDRRRGLQSRD